jgi:hypothetical protein
MDIPMSHKWKKIFQIQEKMNLVIQQFRKKNIVVKQDIIRKKEHVAVRKLIIDEELM